MIMNDSVEVKKIYPIAEHEQLVVHLSTFDWDFERYGQVELQIAGKEYLLRYVGSGNQDGTAFLVLEGSEIKHIVNNVFSTTEQFAGIALLRRID
jgi:hypothetical protein